jgi:FkbM family methyltransferase
MNEATEWARQGMTEYLQYLEDHSDPHFEHPYLKPTSLVVDVGGYRGDWTAKILHKYGPFVTVFEPISENVEVLKLRFQNDYRVNVCPVALEDRHMLQEIWVDVDRSSFFVEEGSAAQKRETVLVEDIGTYPLGGADLISLNCEGSEYRILPRMIQANIVKLFKNIQVQFHYNIAGAMELRDRIRQELFKTHIEQYCFPFVWESWKRKY